MIKQFCVELVLSLFINARVIFVSSGYKSRRHSTNKFWNIILTGWRVSIIRWYTTNVQLFRSKYGLEHQIMKGSTCGGVYNNPIDLYSQTWNLSWSIYYYWYVHCPPSNPQCVIRRTLNVYSKLNRKQSDSNELTFDFNQNEKYPFSLVKWKIPETIYSILHVLMQFR